MPAKIIILGKPNVGKSSLFNVILKKNIAIVDDHPGLTRDIRKKKIRLWDKECELIDSPGFCESSNKINKKIKDYTIEYSKLADVVLLVFDGRSELSSEDLDIISYSRKLNKPILPVKFLGTIRSQGALNDSFIIQVNIPKKSVIKFIKKFKNGNIKKKGLY